MIAFTDKPNKSEKALHGTQSSTGGMRSHMADSGTVKQK